MEFYIGKFFIILSQFICKKNLFFSVVENLLIKDYFDYYLTYFGMITIIFSNLIFHVLF